MASVRSRLSVLVAALLSLTWFGAPGPAAAAATQPYRPYLSASGASSLQWAWLAYPDATKYRVSIADHRDMGDSEFVFTTHRWHTASGLKPGVLYYVAVRAVTSSGLSPASPVTQSHVTASVQGLRVSNMDAFFLDYIWVGWIGADWYEFRFSSHPDMSGARILIRRAKAAHLGSLKAGTTYYAQVRALPTSGPALTPYSPVLAVTFNPSK